jgi:crotonobetainyl-CoA:carnitine CoA-transferase CaiB-like acyl-CoA transferase
MTEHEVSGPLSGLRVVDLASLYAAPLLATLLADLGADVIKIEQPDGDLYRQQADPLWSIVGRNKRSVTLDLKSEEGRRTLHRLLADVDVLVENLPEALLVERGLTPDQLQRINPRLVVASVTGFGRTGPYADRPGSGTLGEAFAGLTHMTGSAGGPPILSSVPLGDAVTAITGAMGVLAALFSRETSGGVGQRVDISTWESILLVLGPVFARFKDDAVPSRGGSRLAGAPVRNVYRTSDAEYVAISCGSPRQLAQITELVAPGDDVGFDQLDGCVARWIGERDLATVMTILLEQRLPVVRVNDARSLIDDPHTQARRAIASVTSDELGTSMAVAPTPRFSATPAVPAMRCPALGEDNQLL